MDWHYYKDKPTFRCDLNWWRRIWFDVKFWLRHSLLPRLRGQGLHKYEVVRAFRPANPNAKILVKYVNGHDGASEPSSLGD